MVASTSSARVDVEYSALTPAVGAEVLGVDLSEACSDDLAASLRAGLLRHGVLVFREQWALMRDSQLAFARCFGDLETYPAGERSHPQIVRIEHGVDAPPTENIWHSDMSFRKDPPLGAVLRGIDVPEVGGDTLFADMRDVWTRVPEKIQTVARGLGAHHDIAKWADASVAESLREAAPIVTHPIVRVHPETKEELLFVNAAYTTAVAGMDAADSAALLDFLFRQVTVPEVQCRVRWEPGTVVLWDNRSVQHYAAGDYLPAGRIMERVSIAGDPVQGAG